jgi:hypothetical protein
LITSVFIGPEPLVVFLLVSFQNTLIVSANLKGNNMDDNVKHKVEEVRQELAPYADSLVDRAITYIVAHPKTTLSIIAALVVAFIVAARI